MSEYDYDKAWRSIYLSHSRFGKEFVVQKTVTSRPDVDLNLSFPRFAMRRDPGFFFQAYKGKKTRFFLAEEERQKKKKFQAAVSFQRSFAGVAKFV